MAKSLSNPNKPTAIGSYVAAILHALEARGVSPQQALAAAQLDRVPGNDPLDRVPLEAVRRLLDMAVEATHDPYFGLYAAGFVRVTTFHALGYALLASTTLRDLCRRVTRYFRLVGQGTRPQFDEGTATLVFEAVAESPDLSHDIVGLFFVRLIRELSANTIRPVSVDLRRPMPPDGGTRHEHAFGCPLRFDADQSRISFDSAVLDRPLARASRELAEHNERIIAAYLSKIDRSDIENRVRALLLEEMPAASVPKNHAHCHSDTSSVSVTQIAYLLGLSDTSNFSRAFHRATGRSPSEHRSRPSRS